MIANKSECVSSLSGYANINIKAVCVRKKKKFKA